MDDNVSYANAAKWDQPNEVGDDWTVWNAPRPLFGEVNWTGEFRSGVFYAAAAPDDPFYDRYAERNAAQDARIVEVVTNDDLERVLADRLAENGYTVADYHDAGFTTGETARQHGLPWHEGPDHEVGL